jgi:hypothetical protein
MDPRMASRDKPVAIDANRFGCGRIMGTRLGSSGTIRRALLACVCLGFLPAGCTSTSWETKSAVPGFRLPHRLYVWVDVSRQVAVSDQEGGVATLVDSLQRELFRRGYEAEVVASDEGKGKYPRLEVLVQNWEAGSGAERQFVGMGFGGAHIDVLCTVRLTPAEKPAFQGHIKGSLNGGDYSTDPTGASEAVGREIVQAITKNG